MAEPPKFAPKKRPKACMQSSDDGSESSVDDLCRKKFKPIAPKPFLKKDGHQSMLTTALPVKDPPVEAKDPSVIDPSTPSSTHNKYGSNPGSSTMPVMYGGPVFIPVRFPFPVLVHAMLNINGNQKCTCCPPTEAPDKSRPAESNEPSLSKSSNVQQPCPVHYSYNSSQPTYINPPIPNVQSSFMPMYMGSGGNMSNKDGEWSEKPKPSKYKYSMLKNGDIYKGMNSSIPGYSDWKPPVTCSSSQYPGQYPHYSCQPNQYSMNASTNQQNNGGRVYDTSVPYPAVPSKCDTMCQTSCQSTPAQPDTWAGVRHPRPSNCTKAVGVDAAVQTESSELESPTGNNQSVASEGRETNSSSVQCSLPSSQGSSSSVSHRTFSSISTGNAVFNNMQGIDESHSRSGSMDLPSTSASNGQSSSNFQTGYHAPPRGSSVPALSTPSRVDHDSRSPVSSQPAQMSTGESNGCEDTPPRRLHSSAFSSTSEVLSSSEALQQRNYETDVIVPLRAAPSPSDAHNAEDMDRFVLSPVISESDSEDFSSRNMPSAATFHRLQQEGRATNASSRLGSRVGPLTAAHPLHASSALPSETPRRNLWSSSNPVQGKDDQASGMVNHPVAASSVEFPHQRWVPSTYSHGDHINPYPVYPAITPYPPTLSRTNSLYPNPHQFSKELQSSLQKPQDRNVPHPPANLFIRNPGYVTAHLTGHGGPGGHQRPETGIQEQREKTTANSEQNAREHASTSSRIENISGANHSGQETNSGVHVQSVPLQSNLASREGQQNLPKDLRDVPQNSRDDPSTVSSFTAPATRHSSTNKDGHHNTHDHRRNTTGAPTHSLHRGTIQGSSLGYHLPYAVPSLVCRNSMAPMHDPVTHSLHGIPPRPSLGMPSIPTAHTFPPGGTYHSQHMYYPHYGGLHQPLSMSPSPSPSDLLSPRSCAHLHLHSGMLHSPQPAMHNWQRPLSSGYHYPVREDRLDSCCTSRVLHSPPREDRSISTLLTNILHRRPGAFSHLERSAAADRNRAPTTLPSQVASTALRSSVGASTSSLQPQSSQIATSNHCPSVPTGTSSLQSRSSQVTASISHTSRTTVTSNAHSRTLQGAPSDSNSSMATLTLTRASSAVSSGRHAFMPPVAPSLQLRPSQTVPIAHQSPRPTQAAFSVSHRPVLAVTSSSPSRMSQITSNISHLSAAPVATDLSLRPVLNSGHSSYASALNALTRPSQQLSSHTVVSSSQGPAVSGAPLDVSSVTTSEVSLSESRQNAPSKHPSSVTPASSHDASRETAASTSQKRNISAVSTSSIPSIGGSSSLMETPSAGASRNQQSITPSPASMTSPISSPSRPVSMSDKYLPSPMATPTRPVSRASGNISDKYLPVDTSLPMSPASSSVPVPSLDSSRQLSDQVVKYGEAVLKCSRQILRESGRTVLCCWSCDYHTAEPRKMHRHQKKENQLQKCQLCDFRADTRCKVNQHYKEVHMDKDDPFRSVIV